VGQGPEKKDEDPRKYYVAVPKTGVLASLTMFLDHEVRMNDLDWVDDYETLWERGFEFLRDELELGEDFDDPCLGNWVDFAYEVLVALNGKYSEWKESL
jgi:hypothetical protein